MYADAELQSLFQQSRDGDREAYAELYGATIEQVLGYIRSKYGTFPDFDYDDLRQELYIKSRDIIVQCRSLSGYSSWLYVIAKRMLLKRSERPENRRRVSIDSDEAFDRLISRRTDDLSADISVCDDRTLETLLKEIDSLPDENREVVNAHFFRGLTYSAMAELYQVSVSTIKRRLGQSFLLLQKQLRLKTELLIPLPAIRQTIRTAGGHGDTFDPTLTCSTVFAAIWAFGKLCLNKFGFLTIPYFWLAYLIVFGNRGMRDLVSYNPDVYTKAWYLRKVFSVYLMLILTPLLIFLGMGRIALLLPDDWSSGRRNGVAVALILALVVSVMIIFIFHARRCYSAVVEQNQNREPFPEMIANLKKKLGRIVDTQCSVVTLAILFYGLFYVIDFGHPLIFSNHGPLAKNLVTFAIQIPFYLCCHFLSWMTLRKLVRELELILPPEELDRTTSVFCQTLYTLFVTLAVSTPVTCLLFGKNMVVSLIELVVFVPWWGWIFRQNRINGDRFSRIFTVFILQFVILFVIALLLHR